MITSHELAELERLRAENAALLSLLNAKVPKSEWEQMVEDNANFRADNSALMRMFSNVKSMRNVYVWDADKREHIPTLQLTFEPVPSGLPMDSKGWRDCEEFEATITDAISKQALQALADIAQELGMGYEK